MAIFGDLERLAGSLYPLRIPIAIALALLFVSAVITAYRLSLHQVIWRHKLPSVVIAGLALVVMVPAGFSLLSPLVVRTSLVEPMPASAAGVPAGTGSGSGAVAQAGGDTVSPAARVIQRGQFSGADAFHFGRGRALISEAALGRYTLRIEDFSVRNGPDLFVFLSTDPSGYAPDAVNLAT